ncbi:MAG: non-heme iron oxygenase ferredoxin subunit [Marinosulfonomonas sp.]|nr:non-heme iron oxygenase ferredoxin subunit [Marinosulfonomonas sp.]
MSQTDPQNTWKHICNVDELDDIDEDEGLQVTVDNGAIVAVFKVNGEYYVIEDLCSHGNASLAEGFLEEFDVECPFHGGKFDIRTGEPTAFPCATAIKVYEVKVGDGVLFAKVSPQVRPNAEEDTDA